MKPVGTRLRLVLPAIMLALPGCTTISGAPRNGDWWQCLGDAQLSALAKRGLATAAAPDSPTLAQTSLSVEIAHRTIALRAQQTALVLLAARAELDSRLVAATQLAETQAEQSRTRAEIAGLRERLAVLTGSAPALLYNLPGGPVPLPPDVSFPSAGYDAARAVAIAAQSQAEHTRTIATLADIRARTGKLPVSDALSAERQAVTALQTEQQARAAMTQAYVALVGASRRREITPGGQHSLVCTPAGQPPGAWRAVINVWFRKAR